MALLSIHIHSGQHHIYTRNRMRDTLSKHSKYLCRNRDDIHDRIRPPVMFTRLDHLNINIFNILRILQQIRNDVFTHGHLTACRNIVAIPHHNCIHMIRLNREPA